MRTKGIGDRIFNIANNFFFLLAAVITIFPLWNVLMISLVDIGEYNTRALILWPQKLYLDSYRYLLGYGSNIKNALGVTVLVTGIGSLYSLIMTTAMAYGLSKKNMPGRGLFITLIVITMFFNGGLIPYYLLIRNLNLMNKFLVLFIPMAINTYYFIIIKSFFSQFSTEIEESARIDGANDLTVFARIVLPLSLPVLATFFLFYAVSYWNSWYNCLLYIQKSKLFTLQYVLRQMVVQSDSSSIPSGIEAQARADGAYLFEDGLRMATVVIATAPIICVYPFLQKYFVKGVMIGSVKG